MPITFSCKQCKAKLKMSSHAAGRAFDCPQCGAKQRAPSPRAPGSAPSSADLAGVPVSQSKALLSSGSSGGSATGQRPKLSMPAAEPSAARPREKPAADLPFDDDEWEAALNPYEAPKEEEEPSLSGYGGDNPRKNRRELRWARWGIKTVNGGLTAGGLSIILTFILSWLSGDEPGGMVKVLMTGAVVLYSIGSVALFVGPILCLGTPEKTGARGYAMLTCVAQTAQLILGSVLLTGSISDPTELAGVYMFAFFAGVTWYFAFVQYMVTMGKYLNRDEVVDAASMVMTLGVVEAIALVLMVALPIVGLEFPDYFWLFGMAAFGAWLTAVFGGLIAVFKYIAALEKLSKAL